MQGTTSRRAPLNLALDCLVTDELKARRPGPSERLGQLAASPALPAADAPPPARNARVRMQSNRQRRAQNDGRLGALLREGRSGAAWQFFAESARRGDRGSVADLCLVLDRACAGSR